MTYTSFLLNFLVCRLIFLTCCIILLSLCDEEFGRMQTNVNGSDGDNAMAVLWLQC